MRGQDLDPNFSYLIFETQTDATARIEPKRILHRLAAQNITVIEQVTSINEADGTHRQIMKFDPEAVADLNMEDLYETLPRGITCYFYR
ncbi:MAG: hypothetical protein JRH15_19800 [Deltaproteobacteria bacterium]|nr:hypothetical protein [Deltaproteobacteria bacterium]